MVQLKPKIRKIRQPRTPRTEAYQKINAYTQTPSKQQVMTLIIFIIIEVLHEVFVTPQVHAAQQAILWSLFGFRYFLIIILAYDYIKLTVKDPVDRLILNPQLRYKYPTNQLRQCSLCATTVQCNSHHCMTCNRCTQDFDHHCKFLNNCIGVRNYEYFIRILIVFCVFTLLSVGIAIWVLIQNTKQAYLKEYRKWIIVGYICFTGLVTIVVASLLIFHMYISCCANITTLQFINPAVENEQKPKLNYLVVQPTPLSAEHFVKAFNNQERRGNDKTNKETLKIMANNKDNPQVKEAMHFYRK